MANEMKAKDAQGNSTHTHTHTGRGPVDTTYSLDCTRYKSFRQMCVWVPVRSGQMCMCQCQGLASFSIESILYMMTYCPCHAMKQDLRLFIASSCRCTQTLISCAHTYRDTVTCKVPTHTHTHIFTENVRHAHIL